ncbi:MAG TPA: autotransporter-associated beta strand repeat-containing protein [Verrucomicrobiae bacterium]|nr:autotransporter-associated beta strand repeat-containing protein [Verrucomicrobiae bacterium]
MKTVLALSVGMSMLLCEASKISAQIITNDAFARDTSGNPIYAQGGGVFKFNGIYYWYGVKYNGAVTYANNPSAGENGDTSFAGISCYSSTNLVNWKFEKLSTSGLGGGWVGRMGVCYNTNTHKYVLIAQQNSGIMFATSDTPNGTFVYDHTQQSADLSFLVNSGTGDQTLFLDDDGTPYLICSSVSGRSHLYVLPLRESDYLEVLPGTEIYHGSGREGNCMFKYNGKYYFCSSDLHGWNASHCYVLESASTNIMGPYLPEYVMNRTDLDFCHVTQTGFFYTVNGTNGTTVLFVGDRWCDFAGNGVGYNQWCPLTFNGTEPTFQSVTAFSLDAAAGTWSIAPGNNYILNPGYEADRVSQTDVAGWTSTGTGFGNVSGSHNPGNWHFHHSNSGIYTATTHQVVTGLPSATYKLSVWYKSSGGQPTAQIFARNFGGDELDADVSVAQADWTQVVITNIVVTNGQCDVGLYSVANANQSVDIDDWSLTISAPPTPTGLNATSGNGQVPLNWNVALAATGYNVKRSTTDGGPYVTIASTATNNFVDNTVVNGTTYFYVVSATNTLGESPSSAQVSVVPSAGPIIVAASANPNPVYPGQNVTINATATQQANPIAEITVDASAIGGATNQILVSDGSGHFTNTIAVGLMTPIGIQSLTINGKDTLGNISAPYSFLLTISSSVETWTGGAGDNNWSSAANWDGTTAPGFGFSLIFAGTSRLAPLMETSYNIHALTFANNAGAFNISGVGGTLTLSGHITNNSPNTQTLNVPLVLDAPITVKAAGNGMTFGQTIDNGGNMLTLLDGGHNIAMNGAVSGAGGLTKIGSGTNTLSAVNTFTGDLAISNGAVIVTSGGQLGGGFYSGSIANNGKFIFDSSASQTLAGDISGTGALNKTGAGQLTLSGGNTFSGATLLASGTMQLGNALALQNSTVNYNAGNITFNGITAASLGALTGSQNLSLANNLSGAVALSVGGNNSTTTYSGNLSGSGSLTKIGTGTLTLTGNSSFSGSMNGNGGTVEVPAGGVVNCGPLNGAGFLLDGGSLTSSGTTTFNVVNNAYLQISGTSRLGDLTEPNNDGLLVKVTGGTFSANSLSLRRTSIFTTAPTATAPISGSTSAGLYINGASADVRFGALTIGASGANSSSSARLDSGSLTVTNKLLIGNTSNTRWEILHINGGSFTSLDTVNGVVLSQNNGTTANSSEFYLSGGTSTVEKIAFGVSSDTVGGNGFLIIGGGTLYLGSGGIVKSTAIAAYASTISLLSGTLGAKADWSSALPMQLSGTSFTIKAADVSNLPHDISLNGVISGGGNLTKTGAGTLTLAGTNTYTGATSISAGELLVNGRTAAGAVTVQNNATLGGTGTVGGATTVQSGGTLSPGNSIGTLTFSNSLTLSAGSTSIFEISKSPLTNDIAKVLGALTNGGTLIVTNISASALAAGDTFKLFNAASYKGAFSGVILPSLAGNLAWNTSSLNTNGTIVVVMLTAPAISTVQISGNNLVFSGSGGTANWPCLILTTTNLSGSWTPMATNHLDDAGNFSLTLTNVFDAGRPQSFYKLQLQ